MRVTLTDRLIAGAKANAGGQIEYFDAKARGLSLRVSAGGTKAWNFHYTDPAGRRRRMTLGTYPALSLASARAGAIESRALVEAGTHPGAGRSPGTVADLVENYLTKHVRPNLRQAAQVERRLRKNVIPVIGAVKLADLHRRDVNRVLDLIIARGSPAQANSLHGDLRALSRWGVARGDLDRDPIAGMSAPAPARHRDRALSDAEIAQVWSKLPALPIDAQHVLRLCLITGQRIGEVAGMRRDEIDLAAREWRLPGSRTKNGHQHVVPLSDMALAEIAAASPDGGRIFGIEAKLIANLVDKAQPTFGLPKWVPHDLRRTALTQMASMGVEPIVLANVANHRSATRAGVTFAIYVKHSYEKEKRQALDLWADRLRAVVGGEPVAKVIPLATGGVR